jgi:hypothetical protein
MNELYHRLRFFDWLTNILYTLVMHILHYLDEIRPADEISELRYAEGEPRQ